jgi:hypothetical protein
MIEAGKRDTARELRNNAMHQLARKNWTCLRAEGREVNVVRGLECRAFFNDS